MEKVKIKWYGPFRVDSVVEQFNDYKDFGVYMITRDWGGYSEKIVYIGMTYLLDFSTRLSEHRIYLLPQLRGNIRVRIGRLVEKRSSQERLRNVENLLILKYTPEYNQKETSTYTGRDLRVVNLGRRGTLDRVIDTEEFEDKRGYQIESN